jgi:hypothetical protein
MKHVFLLALIGIVGCCTLYKRDTRINLLNNGYENILVSISDDISENSGLLDDLKNAFIEASDYLFNVTRYFVLRSKILTIKSIRVFVIGFSTAKLLSK